MVLQMSRIHVLPFRIAIIVIGLDFHGFLCLTLSSHYHTITCDSYKRSFEQTTILRWVSKTRTLDLDHFNPAPSLPFQAQNLELFCLVRSGLMMIQHYRVQDSEGVEEVGGWCWSFFLSHWLLPLIFILDLHVYWMLGDFFIRWLCLDSCIVASNNSLSKVNSFLLLLGFCRWPHQHTFKMIWG